MLTREIFKPYVVAFLVELERIMDKSNFVTANIPVTLHTQTSLTYIPSNYSPGKH